MEQGQDAQAPRGWAELKPFRHPHTIYDEVHVTQDYAFGEAGCSGCVNDRCRRGRRYIRERSLHRGDIHLRHVGNISQRVEFHRGHLGLQRRQLMLQLSIIKNCFTVAVFDDEANFLQRQVRIDRHNVDALRYRSKKD